MTSFVTVTQGNNTTLFRTSVSATEIRNKQNNNNNNNEDSAATTASSSTSNDLSNPYSMTIKMLAELQSKTNDFMNDLVKQENARIQQQQQQGGNNNMIAQRRGRGLNENIEGSESDDGESDE